MLIRKFTLISAFAIAMGFLESAVVVYLREIYYPEGFDFPLKIIEGKLALTEVLRELATLIMLITVGWIAGKNGTGKFGVFIFAFGIWDIFYYVFLKLLIGWPESLMTWDILFLIPVSWVGPVLAPVINALTMVIFGGLIFIYTEKNYTVKIRPVGWILLVAGSLVIIFSYTQDYLRFMQKHMPLTDLFRPSALPQVMEASGGYIPEYFNWWIYGAGQGMVLIAITLILIANIYKVKLMARQESRT